MVVLSYRFLFLWYCILMLSSAFLWGFGGAALFLWSRGI